MLTRVLGKRGGRTRKGGGETRPPFNLQMSGKYGMLDTSNRELQKKGNKMSDVRTIDIIELDGEVLYDTIDTAIEDITNNWRDYANTSYLSNLVSVFVENDEIVVRYEVGTTYAGDVEYGETFIPFTRKDFNITYKF